jgi:hypothetical protein
VGQYKARNRIDGVSPVINTFQAQLKEELTRLYGETGPYATAADIDTILENHTDSPAPEVLEGAFREHFLGARTDFDQTLFHYLLNRLGKAQSDVAKSHCIAMLSGRPEETEYVLRYLETQDLTDDEIATILDYAGSADAIYDYQLYQIVRWFFDSQKFPDKLVNLCRTWAFDKNRQPWLRSCCLAALGKAGDQSDLEMIEGSYATVTTGIEKADVITALERMEIGRRNAFLGRVREDGFLPKCAANYVAQQARA